jgi:formylmethanofuran dehydrogenase subunit B
MAEGLSGTEFEHVVCPLCGMACDDLRVKIDGLAVELTAGGCGVSSRAFQQASLGVVIPAPQIEGRTASLDEATARAADILRAAQLPLLAGLATDVQGARAALNLAQGCGAVVDHMNSAGLFRNLSVLQDGGWISASLTEVRNRADLIMLAGARVFELFPRLVERILRPPRCLFPDAAGRELVLIGPWKPSTLPPELADWRPTIIPVTPPAIADVAASLQAMVAARPLQVCDVAGVEIHTLQNLARRLQQAKYSAVAWAAGEFDFPHAELTVKALVELVRDLNHNTRSAALLLGGAQGEVTTHQVCVWQSGQPLRTSFARGRPRHDSVMFDHRRLLAEGRVDALLWLSSFVPHAPPPETDLPTVVLGHPHLALTQTPAVYIPVGVPGVDHSGHIYRGDQVVALPLRRLRESPLPSADAVMRAIAARL